uniref:Uncharacterized protein n=1 Tax=viral metagenome TaxID=1070528 RepID=A0A6M3Y208_9ZZZZ
MGDCEYRPTERFFLYIMVFVSMINTCSTDTTVNTIEEKVAIIEEYVANQRWEILWTQ